MFVTDVKKSVWRLKLPQADNDFVLKDTAASATFIYMLFKTVACIHDRRHGYPKPWDRFHDKIKH